MREYVLAGIGTIMLMTSAAYAADAPPTNGTPAATAKPEPARPADPVLCKTYPPPIGSLLGARRICHTESEWKTITRDAQDAVEDVQTRSRIERLKAN
jgi:hypothetical protein